jgi:hypothetical protein
MRADPGAVGASGDVRDLPLTNWSPDPAFFEKNIEKGDFLVI